MNADEGTKPGYSYDLLVFGNAEPVVGDILTAACRAAMAASVKDTCVILTETIVNDGGVTVQYRRWLVVEDDGTMVVYTRPRGARRTTTVTRTKDERIAWTALAIGALMSRE